MNDDQETYRVVATEQQFDVVSASDRVVMSCRDSRSANHYATLLNQAFRAGYKAGFRDAKHGS